MYVYNNILTAYNDNSISKESEMTGTWKSEALYLFSLKCICWGQITATECHEKVADSLIGSHMEELFAMIRKRSIRLILFLLNLYDLREQKCFRNEVQGWIPSTKYNIMNPFFGFCVHSLKMAFRKIFLHGRYYKNM